MSGKPVSLQESFPEICDTLREDNRDNEVKSKSTNKTTNPNKNSYQLCQVLQDACAPHRITVVKESFSNQCKQSSCSNEPEAKSQRFIYCKEVVKPFIKKDCRKPPEHIAQDAVDLIGIEFPNFQYCCTSKSPESPKIKIESCIKKEKRCKKPIVYNPDCEKEDFCERANKTLNAALCCIKEMCVATRAAIDKFNEMCQTSTTTKNGDDDSPPPSSSPPPSHPKYCKKPRNCGVDSPNTVAVIVLENPQTPLKTENEPKVTLMDRAFSVTKNAVQTVAETKHYLTKFYSVHSLLLLPLDEIEKQEQEERQKALLDEQAMADKQAMADAPTSQLKNREKELKADQKEEVKLKNTSLNDKANYKVYLKPKLVSMTYIDEDEDEEDDDEDDEDDDDDDDMPQFTRISKLNSENEHPINYVDEDEIDDEEDIIFNTMEKKPSPFFNLVNKIRKKMQFYTEKSQNVEATDKLSTKVMNALENTATTTIETMTNASANLIGKMQKDTTPQASNSVSEPNDSKQNEDNVQDTLVDKLIDEYADDKSSPYDVVLPEPVSESTKLDEEDFFSKIKSKFFALFEDVGKK